MGQPYHLMCIDCKVYIYVGKVYWLDEAGRRLSETSFDGIFDDISGVWHKRDAYFGRFMEKFLLIHRNHEIRFVPEGVDEMMEKLSGYIESIDASAVLELPEPEPDPGIELEEWRRKLRLEGA